MARKPGPCLGDDHRAVVPTRRVADVCPRIGPPCGAAVRGLGMSDAAGGAIERESGAEIRSRATSACETVTGVMETPPPEGLVEREIVGGLADSWSLEIERLRYIPKGFGSYHWLGETSGGQPYFITVDDLDVKPWLGSDRESTFEGLQAAYDTALILHEQAQLHFVVSPVPGPGGLVARRITPRYSLAVFRSSTATPGTGATQRARTTETN